MSAISVDSRAAAYWHFERAMCLLRASDDNDLHAAEHARVGLLYLSLGADADPEADRLLEADEALASWLRGWR